MRKRKQIHQNEYITVLLTWLSNNENLEQKYIPVFTLFDVKEVDFNQFITFMWDALEEA